MNAYKACAWVVFSQYFWHAFRYAPADFSLLTITLSQQSVSKCLLLPWGRLHNWTSFLELPSCKVYSHSLRVGCHAQGAAASLMWWVWIDVCIKTDVYSLHVWQRQWTNELSDIYLLLVLAGWTGWSDPAGLMPVNVMPSDGFFFSRLLKVRLRSTDHSCYTLKKNYLLKINRTTVPNLAKWKAWINKPIS